MSNTPEENLHALIDELNERISGIILYLASKEAGLVLDKEDPDYKKTIKRAAPSRSQKIQMSGTAPERGYFTSGVLDEIKDLAEQLKAKAGTPHPPVSPPERP
jgi:hypothetical protein